jgi:hypothetical protein
VSRGESYLALDRVEEALAEAQHAIDLARRCGERSHEAKALALLAAVRARQDGAREASSLYRDAIARGDALGMRPLVARCQLELGRLAEMTGDRDAGRAEIARAAATFRELAMPYWVAQAAPALVS